MAAPPVHSLSEIILPQGKFDYKWYNSTNFDSENAMQENLQQGKGGRIDSNLQAGVKVGVSLDKLRKNRDYFVNKLLRMEDKCEQQVNFCNFKR